MPTYRYPVLVWDNEGYLNACPVETDEPVGLGRTTSEALRQVEEGLVWSFENGWRPTPDWDEPSLGWFRFSIRPQYPTDDGRPFPCEEAFALRLPFVRRSTAGRVARVQPTHDRGAVRPRRIGRPGGTDRPRRASGARRLDPARAGTASAPATGRAVAGRREGQPTALASGRGPGTARAGGRGRAAGRAREREPAGSPRLGPRCRGRRPGRQARAGEVQRADRRRGGLGQIQRAVAGDPVDRSGPGDGRRRGRGDAPVASVLAHQCRAADRGDDVSRPVGGALRGAGHGAGRDRRHPLRQRPARPGTHRRLVGVEQPGGLLHPVPPAR